jgi:hypothetical protein
LDTLEATGQRCSPAEERRRTDCARSSRFFFRRLRSEDGKRIGRLLVKSPPGLGKTREAMHWAIRYQAEQGGKDGTRLLLGDLNEAGVPAQTSIFVPRHQLAEGAWGGMWSSALSGSAANKALVRHGADARVALAGVLGGAGGGCAGEKLGE